MTQQRYKLGRTAPKEHPKTLRLSKYLTGALPAAVEKVYREYEIVNHYPQAMQMFGNDQYGDCTCAGFANLLILWTSHTGTIVIPTLDEVLQMYAAVCPGFDPTTDANDNGAAMTDVLNYMQTTGLAGQKILGWAAVNFNDINERKIACDLFGATYVGVNLPQSAQTQFPNPWEVVQGDPIEGGHCIIHTGFGALGDNYVTWANWAQKASAAWSKEYVEEEYVVISQNWINQVTQKTPGGLDLATLEADIKLL